MDEPLTPAFFARPTATVARDLLGQRLVRRLAGGCFVGQIVETEAYGGPDDSTSHARGGVHGRAAPMFGPVGHAYVYLIYGQHSCLNVVAHAPGAVGAILIRALAPEVGMEYLTRPDAPRARALATTGPGRLTRALGLDRSWSNAWLLDATGPLFVAAGPALTAAQVTAGPRVGVVGAAADCARPWRFTVADNPYVSGRPVRPTVAKRPT